MGLELSHEEQKLQDLMDKLTEEIYSQLGISRLKAETYRHNMYGHQHLDLSKEQNANKYKRVASDAHIQENLKEKYV